MQLIVLDANGVPQTITVPAPAAPLDYSGTIQATGQSQQLAAPNNLRSGYQFQNQSTTDAMTINSLGNDATQAGSWTVGPGQYWPPPGYPVVQGELTVAGVAGDAYTYQEW